MSRNDQIKVVRRRPRVIILLLFLTCNCWYVLCVCVCLNGCSSSGILLAFLLILAHFLKALSVCSADKVRLHIINTALRIHQVLIVLAFYLDHAHDHAVDHVDRFSFVFLTFAPFFVVFDALIVLFKVVLNALTAIIIRVIGVVLK